MQWMKIWERHIVKFNHVLLLGILLVNQVSHSDTKDFNTNETDRLMERAVFALEKVLYFYKQNYDTLNIDSLLGMRVTEGTLRKIVLNNDNLDGKSAIGKTKIISAIRKMYFLAENISKKSLPIVRDDNVEAFKQFYKIISKPWKLFQPFQKLHRDNSKKSLNNVIFDGPMSDHCISLVLGEKDGHLPCNITHSCWQFETQKDVDGYTPTHQVLYFLFGLGESCENTFNQKFQETGVKKDVQGFLHELCQNIFQTADELWQDSNLLEFEKDLFMEQALVCSLAGYEDFLNESYLDKILQWQIDTGCFGTQV